MVVEEGSGGEGEGRGEESVVLVVDGWLVVDGSDCSIVDVVSEVD